MNPGLAKTAPTRYSYATYRFIGVDSPVNLETAEHLGMS